MSTLPPTPDHLLPLLTRAFEHRQLLLADLDRSGAVRLFNGFWEGWPELAVDLYGQTLVLHGYSESSLANRIAAEVALAFYQARLGDELAALFKDRSAADPEQRRGRLLAGQQLDRQVSEHGVWFALDLDRHQDASLYLDTRMLREWAQHNLGGARVLNTFAYTGSLGAAALAGGAEVLQTDLSGGFLSLARRTYQLNGWPAPSAGFLAGDFFAVVARLKRQGALFDCVFLDPPVFSVTARGRVDLNAEYGRLINKVRPLVAHEGRLVVVNNAVFVSGQAYWDLLKALNASGYVQLEETIPVPIDFTGFNGAPLTPLPADPAPFNYSTKIAVLRLQRKDKRR